MRLCFRGLLLLIIKIHTNKTNEMIFIDKALPNNTKDIKDNKHFFFELFKNQKNNELLKIKNELKDEKNSIFNFLIFDKQDLTKESKTKIDFFWQLVHLKTLLKIKNFSKLDPSDKKSKIIKIKDKIEKKDDNKNYKEILQHFSIDNTINENIGYAKYIHKKLGEKYQPISEQLPTSKKENKFIKISSIIIMISAAAILIYFFILIETITISGNKETIHNIKIISSDGGEVIKGVVESKNEKNLNIKNNINSKNLKKINSDEKNFSDEALEERSLLEEENDDLENDENIITPESSCFE